MPTVTGDKNEEDTGTMGRWLLVARIHELEEMRLVEEGENGVENRRNDAKT